MKRFADVAEAIACEPGKLAKTSLLASYLRALEHDDDVAAAARFFGSSLSVSVGSATIVAAAKAAWGITDDELGASYRSSGDLGTALAEHLRAPHDLGLFRMTLTPGSLMRLLDEMATASGKAANRRRRILVERALGSCETPLEAKYLIKVLTGDLRIGLREGLILEGIAEAFDAPIEDVRRAAMAARDVGVVAIAAKDRQLARVEIAYGSPISFMLASPLAFGSEYKELTTQTWLVEDKYDGVRIQAHKYGDRVRLFSRRMNETSDAWPEVVTALRETVRGDVILDGEIVAVRGEGISPFRELQTRLQRKDPTPELLASAPVAYVVFDCLARDRDFMLDRPLEERREILADLSLNAGVLRTAPWSVLETGATQEDIAERFVAARTRGNEGLLFKRTDCPYVPGKRGKAWMKLKRELDTLDAVVVAVEWGHGRRAQVLSDYTFAVRGANSELLVIGKAYSGLTDVEILEMTGWFQSHRIPEGKAEKAYAQLGLSRWEIPVEPQVVVEIAFDVVHRSDLHKSGFALR
ncbi:MAG: ATP-dependent DNA ligase, partial [Vulcanimicrobiaceae bacterium]